MNLDKQGLFILSSSSTPKALPQDIRQVNNWVPIPHWNVVYQTLIYQFLTQIS